MMDFSGLFWFAVMWAIPVALFYSPYVFGADRVSTHG